MADVRGDGEPRIATSPATESDEFNQEATSRARRPAENRPRRQLHDRALAACENFSLNPNKQFSLFSTLHFAAPFRFAIERDAIGTSMKTIACFRNLLLTAERQQQVSEAAPKDKHAGRFPVCISGEPESQVSHHEDIIHPNDFLSQYIWAWSTKGWSTEQSETRSLMRGSRIEINYHIRSSFLSSHHSTIFAALKGHAALLADPDCLPVSPNTLPTLHWMPFLGFNFLTMRL